MAIATVADCTVRAVRTNDEAVAEHLAAEEKRVVSTLHKLFEEADTDGSGEISREELLAGLDNPKIRQKLELVGVQTEEASGLFDMLDDDGGGSCTIGEFTDGILLTKGTAKSFELLKMSFRVDDCSSQSKRMVQVAKRNDDLLHDLTARLDNLFTTYIHPPREISAAQVAALTKRSRRSRNRT